MEHVQSEEQMSFIIARPLVTIFHNPTNLFSIIKVKIRKTNCSYKDREIVVKGNFPELSMEEEYRFTGRLVEHPMYGQQFDIHTFEKELPKSETGVVHYLSGELFPGVGKRSAQNIVNVLGTDAIQKIIDNPAILDTVPKLSESQKETLQTVLQENMGLERTIVQLNEWGFGPQVAMRIYQLYRDESIELLTENPYRLIEEVEGIGFQRADELGRQLGIVGNHPSRIKAAILFTLNQAVLSAGHVYIEAETLLPNVKQLLEASQSTEIPFDAISAAIIELVEEGKLAGEQQRIYIPSLYFSELGIASKLERLLNYTLDASFSEDEIQTAIAEVEEQLDVTYATTQRTAIETALQSSVMILTGGPGTGKTTVIRGLVETYAKLYELPLDPKHYAMNEEPFPIILAAPTGRAAKRMAESTGLPAMTIHRLLGFTGKEKAEENGRDIEGRLIIIDETSMVDTWLAHQLLKALPTSAQLLFVGDQDQLPSVGPGQVLRDLLQSKKIPIVELTDIYRQSAGSTIIELAHQIKKSEWHVSMTGKTADRSFIKSDTDQIRTVVEQVLKSALAKGHRIQDIQVLAPMYKGPAGIDSLNKMIQEMVNPPSPKRKEMTFGEVVYRIGDKVLQLVNQPESNVFNGDMGEVISIIEAKETVDKKAMLIVSYDGIEVEYERAELNQITLAYCCSIHKSQGSEFSTVIMPIVRSHRKMLRRNLLYTGITRAKNFLILCGEPSEFQLGIERTDELERQTTLQERLTGEAIEEAECIEEAKGEEVQLLADYRLTTDNCLSIDPMIGMHGMTPYDFLTATD